VTAQIEAVAEDLGCDAVKTGMLATSAIVEAVAATIQELELPNVVVDPVMVAKGGDRLLDDDAVHALRTALLRLARLVTPNVPEAEVIAQVRVQSVADMREAGRRIQRLGAAAVLVKGGHLPGDTITDVLVEGAHVVELSGPRIVGRHTHGTGCTLAAAIAARLALGDSLQEAVSRAKAYVAGAMRFGIDLGAGHQPLNHLWSVHGESKL
jgi:hydroxymethylpyrimidine/phosphomethylpyrimidine kinase